MCWPITQSPWSIQISSTWNDHELKTLKEILTNDTFIHAKQWLFRNALNALGYYMGWFHPKFENFFIFFFFCLRTYSDDCAIKIRVNWFKAHSTNISHFQLSLTLSLCISFNFVQIQANVAMTNSPETCFAEGVWKFDCFRFSKTTAMFPVDFYCSMVEVEFIQHVVYTSFGITIMAFIKWTNRELIYEHNRLLQSP